jgi:ankyrin repeat protein
MNIDELKIVFLKSDLKLLKSAMKDFEINQQDKFGNNILHYYIKNKKEVSYDISKVFSLFLSKGLDIDNYQATGNFRYSPLHLAVFLNSKEIFDVLIENDANVNAKDINGNSVLSSAVFNYSKDKENYGYYITKLLELKADINSENNYGVTPITLAKSIANSDVSNFFP